MSSAKKESRRSTAKSKTPKNQVQSILQYGVEERTFGFECTVRADIHLMLSVEMRAERRHMNALKKQSKQLESQTKH